MTQPPDIRPLVDRMLSDAIARRASDIHLEPVAGGNYEVRFRIDGLLQLAGTHDGAIGRAIAGRLMVMANLLTYRLDIPQEGRASVESTEGRPTLDLRLAVMPAAHGLRAVIRLPAELAQPRTLAALGLPQPVLEGLHAFAAADQGILLVTGPAGSGKTTTLYALLSHIAATSQGLSIITLEDPIERHVEGITQIEVQPFGEMTYERALRSILRQDPQVLMLGEVRDAATASLALQAGLSGHRLVCTLHAGSPPGAISRLLEMGLEPYQVAGSLFGVVAQRLVRRRSSDGNGYEGRIPIAEFVAVDAPLRQAIVSHADIETIANLIRARPGHQDLAAAAAELVSGGNTDEAEVLRVIGRGGSTA